jgi:hypothetical protein
MMTEPEYKVGDQVVVNNPGIPKDNGKLAYIVEIEHNHGPYATSYTVVFPRKAVPTLVLSAASFEAARRCPKCGEPLWKQGAE